MPKNITYAAPEIMNAGFSLGGPVLDVLVDGETAGSILRIMRNRDRWTFDTVYYYQPISGRPSDRRTSSLEEQILWVQGKLSN